MNKKNGPTLGHNKKSLLKSEVEHIDITSFDARKIIESMKKCHSHQEIQQKLLKFIMK